MTEDCGSSITKLLNPELMTLKELSECLIERCIVYNVGLDKPALVELVRRFLTPLPQRTYNVSNRLGAVMRQKQLEYLAELEKSKAISGCNGITHTRSAVQNVESVSHEAGCHQAVDRLKSVPSAVNYGNKRIKLSNTTPVVAKSCDIVLVLDNSATNTVCPEKSVTVAAESASFRSPVKPTSISPSAVDANTRAGKRPGVTEDNTEEKKKFKPSAITWP